ncbi:kinase-like domain-containing protein [Roridomyces roridus]|uniref:non-specific serine/threonine protein kinase n=1 Tax=Roridomyces roridus TaxID=1738132 RepID=A0AAD7B574_9AGAR|nr:kinase-like domain-containing protein [Roridomyces roridus]
MSHSLAASSSPPFAPPVFPSTLPSKSAATSASNLSRSSSLPLSTSKSLRLLVWSFHLARKSISRTKPPTPVLQPEKTADNPPPTPQLAPPPPPPPIPPPPTLLATKWDIVLLDGDETVGPDPDSIVEGPCIGKGGFAEVFRGLNKATGQAVAVKRVKKKALGEDGQYLILGEIRIMNRIRDTKRQLPFPIILGSYMDDSDYLLVMNHLPGTMLAKLEATGGYFDQPLAFFYAGQLLLAIHTLHSLGVVHCDVKPDNIFLDSFGNVVLGDFGVAKLFNKTAKGDRIWSDFKRLGGDSFPLLWPTPGNPHCLDSDVRGTRHYAAPETKTDRYSYGVDYWSWAATFFEFLTGVLPWAIDDETSTYIEPLHLDLAHNAFRKAFLERIDFEFSTKAFLLDPFDRWPTVHEIKKERIWGNFDWLALSRGTLPIPSNRAIVAGRRIGRLNQ